MEAEEDSKHWGKTVKGQQKEKMEIIISGNKTEYGPTKKPDS